MEQWNKLTDEEKETLLTQFYNIEIHSKNGDAFDLYHYLKWIFELEEDVRDIKRADGSIRNSKEIAEDEMRHLRGLNVWAQFDVALQEKYQLRNATTIRSLFLFLREWKKDYKKDYKQEETRVEQERLYSLNEVLRERYYERLLEKYDGKRSDVIGKSLDEAIKFLEQKVSKEKTKDNEDDNEKEDLKNETKTDDSKDNTNSDEGVFQNFAKEQRKYLFKILDVFIENSKEKLKIPGKNRYEFTEDNKIFLLSVLAFYYEDDRNYLLAGEYEEIDEDWKNLLTEGLLLLAKNPSNSLDEDEICRKCNWMFNIAYRSLIKSFDELAYTVKNYGFMYRDESALIFGMKDIIHEVNDELIKLCEEYQERRFEIDISNLEKKDRNKIRNVRTTKK